MRIRQLVVLASLVVTAGALVAGASAQAAGKKMAPSRKLVVSTRRLPGLGRVLVDQKGLTLYMFVPDKRKRVTCKSTCAAVWPPVKLAKNERLVPRGGVKGKLLGSDRDPQGGRVVTYHGWPLYTYVGDFKAGQATGQALDLNGGLWFVLAPSGKVIKTKPAGLTSGTTATHTTSGGVTTATTAAPPAPAPSTTTMANDGCPAGVTIPTSGNTDNDNDENGQPSDGDGCI